MPPRRSGGGFFSRFDTSQLRITRGAMVLLFIQVGLSLVWLLSDRSVRADLIDALAPSGTAVFERGRVWTLATGPFLETGLAELILGALMFWWFLPRLERWWGTRRFVIFFAATSLAGTVGGSLVGWATHSAGVSAATIIGYGPFLLASIVAFGILYGKQPVQFFGALPMTARQMMYGILAFSALFVLLGQQWERAGAYVAAIGVGAAISSGKVTPRLWWYRWRHQRAKKKLAVFEGGKSRAKRPSEELLN